MDFKIKEAYAPMCQNITPRIYLHICSTARHVLHAKFYFTSLMFTMGSGVLGCNNSSLISSSFLLISLVSYDIREIYPRIFPHRLHPRFIYFLSKLTKKLQ